MFKALTIGAAMTALVGITVLEIRHPPKPKLLYNPSKSAPIGYYKIMANADYKNGDFVAAFAPERARQLANTRNYLPENYPLIKQIWASRGETICANDKQVSGPNGSVITRVLQDRLGRNMPTFDGCFTLEPDEFFLISIDENYGRVYGFDSRYFGPVGRHQILGRVQYLGKDIFARGGNRREEEAKKGK